MRGGATPIPWPPERHEAAVAVGFVYAFTVNTLRGLLAELLAAGPVAQTVLDLQHRGGLPAAARVLRRRRSPRPRHLVRRLGQGGPTSTSSSSTPAPTASASAYTASQRSSPSPGLPAAFSASCRSTSTGPAEASSSATVPSTLSSRSPSSQALDPAAPLPPQCEKLHLPALDVPIPEDRLEEVTPAHGRVTLRWSQEA